MTHGSLARQPSGQPRAAPPLALEPAVRAHLGRQLRAVYDDLANQPVPDRFVQLLNALESKQARISPEATSASAAAEACGGKKAGDA